MKVMDAQGLNEKITTPIGVLVGVGSASAAQEFARELVCYARKSPISIASEFGQFKNVFARCPAAVAVIDDEILPRASYAADLRAFVAKAPIILIGDSESRCDFRRFIAEGNLDFVSRGPRSVSIAVSLVERRLRWLGTQDFSAEVPSAFEWHEEIGEIFRHEINNPLTGILGNAEMLLQHNDHLSEIETQRLQTVVHLAVRLRETVRRLSQSLENPVPTAKSA